jgi:hypothetical protein
MRWFLGLLLVIALVCGVLYGVGRFLLPNSLSVTRTISIERPRAAVFAMTNDLRIAKEWSPYYARDPDADYSFGGEGPGAGQSMRWVSNNREVGSGRMSIFNSLENQRIEAILELNNRATLNSEMSFQPGPRGTAVVWSLSAECAQSAVNVPCRYMNLILRRIMQNDMDSGLRRLKTLVEQLPNVDFESLNPEFVPVDPQPYVYSSITSSNQDANEVSSALNDGLDQVTQYMTQHQLTRAGPQIRVTTDWEPAARRMSFRVGYPYSGATPLTVVGVQFGQTPSGPALRVAYRGPRSGMASQYAQIDAYMQAHRIARREGGLPWEVVQDPGSGDAAPPMAIDIYVPLAVQ